MVLVDLEKEQTVDDSMFYSKGKNSPFIGRKVKGRIVCTIMNGEMIFKN
jgi:dihydroorotase